MAIVNIKTVIYTSFAYTFENYDTILPGGQTMNEIFIKRLSDLLEEKEISQRDLSVYLHTSESNISRYLKGRSLPSAELLSQMAKVFDVNPDYLLGVTSIRTRLKITDEQALLLDCYDRASDQDKDVVWAVLRKYNKQPVAASNQDKWSPSDDSYRQDALKNFESKK